MIGHADLARERVADAEAALRGSDQRRAVGHLKAAIGTDPSQAIAHRVSSLAGSLDAKALGLVAVRVAFLSDHLVGPIPHLLRAQALLSDLLVEPFVPDFDVWQQEISDPGSRLYAFDPSVVILDLNGERLAPALFRSFLSLSPDDVDREIDRACGTLVEALDALRRRSAAKVILHSFPRPPHPALGIFDRLTPNGETAAVERLTARLRNAVAERSDVYALDVDLVSAEVGSSAFFDRRMYALAKLPYSGAGVARLAIEYAKYLRGFFGRSKKVLVLDADNTLWGGIVGEDGLDGIKLDEDSAAGGYIELQRYVAELGKRGVILALNSANERADVIEVFAKRREMILRQDDFAIIVANWNDKAQNLVEIAEALELGLDSFVFADDDPVQCARIRDALPDVAVVELSGDPFTFASTLARHGWFDVLSLTDEDRQRNALYRADASRHELERIATSQEEFVGSLQVRLLISRLAPGGLARAASLTQRTNQFNLTTRRYTEDDLRRILSDPAWRAFTARVVDRFGDIGVIGLVMTRRDQESAIIDTFLMSCRALRRCVEDAMLAIAVAQARKAGSRNVIGTYIPTRKNGQTAHFYPRHGFTPIEAGPSDEQRWVRTESLPMPPVVSVTFEDDGW